MMHDCGCYGFEIEYAKLCASFAVDEIIEAIKIINVNCSLNELDSDKVYSYIKYWREVNANIAIL